ncbi:unnamed protein product [Calypogeia fissa]
MLQQEVPKVVKSLNKQLRERSVKTKVGAFSVLKELVIVLPNCLSDHIMSLVPGIEKALNDKSSNSNLKIEALVFLRLVLASHSPTVFHPHIKALSAPVLTAVSERYYKSYSRSSESLWRACQAIRPSLETVSHPLSLDDLSSLFEVNNDLSLGACLDEFHSLFDPNVVRYFFSSTVSLEALMC